MPIDLRPAVRADAAYLLQLEESCMRAYAEALWVRWKPSATIAFFDPAGHFLIRRDDVTVGCLAELWHEDHLRIGKLYVDASFRRQGIGGAILRMKSMEAAAAGLPIRLSVLTTNPADAFYRREGFVMESETAERRQMSKPPSRMPRP